MRLVLAPAVAVDVADSVAETAVAVTAAETAVDMIVEAVVVAVVMTAAVEIIVGNYPFELLTAAVEFPLRLFLCFDFRRNIPAH